MKLPCDECKGRCCSSAAMSVREFKTLRKKYGMPNDSNIVKFESFVHASYKQANLIMVNKKGSDRCAYFVGNKCSVYDDRPKVCRDYGIIPQLPCEYLNPWLAFETDDDRIRRLSGDTVTDTYDKRECVPCDKGLPKFQKRFYIQ